MKYLFAGFCMFCYSFCWSQDPCNLKKAPGANITLLDADDISCIARNTVKKNTLIFTFASWCAPCRAHLPNAIKLARESDLEFYVLLVEEEQSLYVGQAMEIISRLDTSIKVAVLKDQVYGRRRGGKNKQFLTEIIPARFPQIFDYSKYILLNKQGDVIMVTSYKDNKGNSWRSDSTAVADRIMPLL